MVTEFIKVEDGLNQNIWKDADGNFYVGRDGQTPEEIIAEMNNPENTSPPPIIEVPSVTLWERLTEAEAEQVNAAMATQPFRTRQIFLTANTFRSDHELWPLLVQMATDLFGEARAAELLAP
ncbi:hypothetical protein [Brucella sp. 6810]|uniref:hypothetical protein n=1 Tax=Brucella sp. 6810 TaxID=2769351 RepID=UPI0020000F51|nr:hypothetical protein [Brucella sp. 6810]